LTGTGQKENFPAQGKHWRIRREIALVPCMKGLRRSRNMLGLRVNPNTKLFLSTLPSHYNFHRRYVVPYMKQTTH
jgi:hypothetical protein